MYSDTMGSTTQPQQYCLRWNNHRSNMLTVFDELLKNEEFTDVTLACDGGMVKGHRVVLASCSPYFQALFTELPCTHPVVVLKDVKYTEIQAILEYMYRGEVNVAQDQLPELLKVAEMLNVKGLVEEHGNKEQQKSSSHDHPVHRRSSPPTIITSSVSNVQSAAQSSSSNDSPPHSTGTNGGVQSKVRYSVYGKSPVVERETRIGPPMWQVPGITIPHHQHIAPTNAVAAAMLSGLNYETASQDMSPLKRKRLSSMIMSRDNPILRTVLGQGQADSSQPVSLVCHPDSREFLHSNGSAHSSDKVLRNEPSEEAQSPYTDIPLVDEDDKSKIAQPPSTSPQSYPADLHTVSSGIATYVPSQKPEWKRYKQYTRNDILSAIEAVRTGMSALKASQKFGVPSRTLYDKVKKLGISTSRPCKRETNGSNTRCQHGLSGLGSSYIGHPLESETNISCKRGTNGGGARYSYELSGTNSPYSGHLSEGEETSLATHHSTPLSESRYLHRALATDFRSPSPRPSLLYMRQSSPTPSPAGNSNHRSDTNGSSEFGRDDDNQVEDLSMQRKEAQTRVIVPPMNQVSTIIKKEESIKEILHDDIRRDIQVDEMSVKEESIKDFIHEDVRREIHVDDTN